MNNSELAKTYFKLLTSLDWKDEHLLSGIKEGLNKFLSNLYLQYTPGSSKYCKTHFASETALEKIKSKDFKYLVFEHVVPKARFIQGPCEAEARKGALTLTFIEVKLNQFWKLATITEDENRLLSAHSMPADWDGIDLLARYKKAGITLVDNPFFRGGGGLAGL